MTLQTLFASQARLLEEGRVAALARSYSLPLPVFLPDDGTWHLLRTRAAVIETFWTKHQAVRAAGVGRLRACVIEEDAAGDRLRGKVMWFYIGDGGRRLGRTVVDYYLTRRPEGLMIDMMAFRRIAFPQLHGWFANNATELRRGVRPQP